MTASSRPQPPDLSLRPGVTDDSEFAHRVRRATLREYVEQSYGWVEAQQRVCHESTFRPDQTQIIIHRGVDVGMIVAVREPNRFCLRQIFVLPEY